MHSYMKRMLHIPLNTTSEQLERLLALQRAFAQVCNALAPVVVQTRVWNRVALHHLMYRSVRERFPELGSQMVCNAIYSVSRTCRVVYQSPASPFNLGRLGNRPLPLLRFADSCPVYFDRHTLSVNNGQLSMFTLDGRMRFSLALLPDAEAQFKEQKLHEIVMARQADGLFALSFVFGDEQGAQQDAAPQDAPAGVLASAGVDLPEYVLVEESV